MSGGGLLRTACNPPLSGFLSLRFFHPRRRRPSALSGRHRNLGHASSLPSLVFRLDRHGFIERSCYVHSLVESVMEELAVIRATRRIRATAKVGLPSSNELFDAKLEKKSLQKGLLLEFRKESQKTLLAVVQKPDGKKNWMVCDQNGVICSIKPQQVTYVVPGIEDFDHTDISEFVQKAQGLLDPSILECAWIELSENKRTVTAEELAEIIYGSKESLESYCSHLLLSRDDIYFNVVDSKAYCSLYEPRPSIQILKAMGLMKTSSTAVNLLIDIGYFPVHVNLDLFKFNIHTEYSEEVMSAAENLLAVSNDLDELIYFGLTLGKQERSYILKVYAIDVDDADELDDALSATRLPDGRIKLWIHVADPTCLVAPHSILDREAMRRGTSIFLPTATYPMFPEKLAMEGMSLQQGKLCRAVSVSVTLSQDGSIADFAIENSIIRPTYMLTYENATELLHLNLEEEAALRILSEAALLRFQWRCDQDWSSMDRLSLESDILEPPNPIGRGAIDTATIDPRIKVANPDDPEPSITLYVEDQSNPAMRLVSEMMILCGEVIATFGSCNNISLPYRGQPQSNISASAFSHLPEGPARSAAYLKIMAAEMIFRNPIRHGLLGLPGYVQFTSPIRRYIDLLAHYQVKAFIRGESLPFSAGELEGMTCLVNMHVRVAKRLQSNSLRYWLLEYLRRQERGRTFSAMILRLIKDRTAALLLTEVGVQAIAIVSAGKKVGDELKVTIDEAHPRDDVLSVREV
ncbi:RNB [Musa troglodytarum]|uniref:RNB n=1 Tax=Musa troglodytarum TaxID=320322 RepID=A0A9E7JK46_9LILI|nr:RNB [Musa troglodytarum]